MRYKEIKDKITDKYESLPKNQKLIAEFFIDNFDRVPFLSVQEISKATKVSVASIVRFAQRIGFKGFLELRDEIGATLQNHIEKKEIFSLVETSKLKDDTLAYIAAQDIENINQTINSIDRQSFRKAAGIILSSDKVYTSGLGISFLLAEILSYQLNQVGVESSNFTHNYTSFLEQILYLTKRDCIVAISLPPYSRETIDAVKFAKERGVKIIAITNKNASPVTFQSDVSLIVSSKNTLYTNSFSAISVIINALTTECAFNNKSKAKKMLNELDAISERQKLVINP